MRNYGMKHPYAAQIEQRITTLKENYKRLADYLPEEKRTKEWFKIVSEMNSISTDIAIQKSRLENYGKDVYLPHIETIK